MDMGTQGSGRKRLPNRERLTAEDDALNQIAREAPGPPGRRALAERDWGAAPLRTAASGRPGGGRAPD
ncbi:hypothetical protein K5549_009345 [Capra hircus]|nr:hypothetical protein K5549_009345 [Capra hircus]